MAGDVCPFCLPERFRVFFEGPLVLGLWDAHEVSPGHALVFTRRHVASWFEATLEERDSLTNAIEIAREAIVRLYSGVDGFNIGINIGEAAGQTVPHLHVHVIPRRAGDVSNPRGGVRNVIPGRGDYGASKQERLLTAGPEIPLLPCLEQDLLQASSVDIAVSFVMSSGVDLLYTGFEDLLARKGRLRLVTGDYLEITDPDALRRLHDLAVAYPDSVDLRIFVSAGVSFHPKSYIFMRGRNDGVAYVGSSNLSRSAFEEGVEWNYRIITSRDRDGFAQVTEAFEALFSHTNTRKLDAEWIDAYRARRRPEIHGRVVDATAEPVELPPTPNEIQTAALTALANSRLAGNKAGLVVLATGLGKTWLAAFDSNQSEYRKVLFVAHREEILSQAMATFRRIRPTASFGFYNGQEKIPEADIVFASIQTLGRQAHLDQFDARAFDYVVVDEFHHASASTYRRLIQYFEPRFLLGLTATPERTDGGDLLQLCQENLVYRCDLAEGIRRNLLCPFHYFGVPDEVDYQNIPWRSTRFDEEALTTAVATKARAQNVLEQWRKRGGDRTLAFCVSQRHADFMREYFREAGVKVAAVHAASTSDPRSSSIELLGKGDLQVVFAVDMFNEGVDIPAIDTVMMLRPTESQIIWLQQIGRGLRKLEGKHLNVIDYIGNHRTFLLKARTLLQLAPGNDRTLKAALEAVMAREWDLPPGCEVTYDLKALEIMTALMRLPKMDEALKAYYEDFRERQGIRPLAAEAYHDGYNPRSSRRAGYGSWLRFVREMKDLSTEEQAALDANEDFLDAMEVTPMTRSFKMLLVLAMLNKDALPGDGLQLGELAKEFGRLAQRSPQLMAEVGTGIRDQGELERMLERNPIDAWAGGKGTKAVPMFEYRDRVFRFRGVVATEQRVSFQRMVRELADWRLAEYLQREVLASSDGFYARVSHANGRPLLFLPDRTQAPAVPLGWTSVTINEQPYEANFVKVALNVVRKPGSDENELPSILRGWFGQDAGLPGTDHSVMFEKVGDTYAMKPARESKAAVLELWRSYSREQIPPLFGETFSEAIWNAGFVTRGKNVWLLVTLDKGGMTDAHKYADRFLGRDLFQWQSQNRTTQESKHGHLIHDHLASGVEVHLFVRKEKKTGGGAAAPFAYCGPVRFESWEGEEPITIKWRLSEELPERLWAQLGAP